MIVIFDRPQEDRTPIYGLLTKPWAVSLAS